MGKKLGFDQRLQGMALQDYFSLGYLFLVVLGLIDNLIYYETLGINIFNYTSISDILLTPLNTIFGNYKVTFAIILALIIFYYFLKYFLKYSQEKNRKAAEKQNKEYQELTFEPITSIIFLFMSLFLGINIGSTHKVKSNIETNNFRLNESLVFSDNTQKDVYVVGHNSTYLFYIEKNSKDINVVPISGNIKSMRKIGK
jgi:Ca2+/Na+ antiporter